MPHLSPVAERYLTLLRVHPTKRYSYEKRGLRDLPVIEIDQHAPKCKQGESWLYFAVPASADLRALRPDERLYVGAQTQDRMFRGDGLNGSNYHHAEMRAGNGTDTPVDFLSVGHQIAIYRVSADRIADQVRRTPVLEPLTALLVQPRTPRKHLGWWFEQYILFAERGLWRWNTAMADRSLSSLFASR